MKRPVQILQEYHQAINDNNINKIKEIFSYKELTDDSVLYNSIINSELTTMPVIMYLAKEKNWEMFKLLYELGVDLDVSIKPNDWYLVHDCMCNAPNNIYSAIIEECKFNVVTSKGKSLMMIAIERGLDDKIEDLIVREKVNYIQIDNEKENLLHYAAKYNKQELFIKLIEKGVDLFQTNNDKKTPLDLIEDEIFRNSIPKILEDKNILIKDKSIKNEIYQENITQENMMEEIKSDDVKDKKVKSLSTIIKKK